MSFDDLLRITDTSISIAVLLYVIWRMETGHTKAIAWYQSLIEKYIGDEHLARRDD